MRKAGRGREKGVYGDRSRYKRTMIIGAVAILAFIIILMIHGMVRFGTRKNIFTLMAILAVLPFAKIISILSTLLPNPSLTPEKAGVLAGVSGEAEVLYDVVFATEKTVFPIDCILLEEGRLLVLAPVKDKKRSMLQDYLKDFMKKQGYTKCTVKIEDDYEAFTGMLKRAGERSHKNRRTGELADAFLVNCV